MTSQQRAELLALAERVEQEGPSVRLKLDILAACEVPLYGPPHSLPDPCASLDAAVTLVPEGAWVELSGPRKYLNIPTSVPNHWRAAVGDRHRVGWAATPAAALTAAALRALAQEAHDD